MEEIGSYKGYVAEGYDHPELIDGLERLPDLLEDGEVLASGKNKAVEIALGGKSLVVKRFSKEPRWKDRVDETRGSAAHRSWIAAQHLAAHGVGTPKPVAFLEQRENGQLVDSYFVTERVGGALSFRDALLHLYYEDPVCEKFMSLLDVVSAGVRDLHACGFQHRDLGNQNILLLPGGDGYWCDACFIDLNRGRICAALSEGQRGRDISRIALPSDLMRAFLDKYCGVVPSRALVRAEQFHRRWYRIHDGTRKLRHPIREASRQRKEERAYPSPKETWIWDERSAQAIGVLTSRDRQRFYTASRNIKIAFATAAALPGVWREYRSLLSTCFQKPVKMDARVGVSIDPCACDVEREMSLLSELGPVPVLIRIYHHENPEARNLRINAARKLHDRGHRVSLALVQDRNAVMNPSLWREFCEAVLGAAGDCIEMVELGHAANRVKWGIWNLDEVRHMMSIVTVFRERFPDVKICGPACIDFEYPFLIAALKQLPAGERLGALSHHLYVDRRGAPENRQGRFSLLEKCVLARAIARWSENCDDGLIVSEVNWPLEGQGVYSPVGAPYVAPGVRKNDPSISEDAYADYMLRYLCIAITSGMVERVYWWRLVARGYGLVDDSGEQWRKRPAFEMLKVFLEKTRGCEFRGRTAGADGGLIRFRFGNASGAEFELVYCVAGEVDAERVFAEASIEDAFGKPVNKQGLKIGGRPVYVVG